MPQVDGDALAFTVLDHQGVSYCFTVASPRGARRQGQVYRLDNPETQAEVSAVWHYLARPRLGRIWAYDLRADRLVGKWQFEGLISLRSPAFRPDGREVVFVGLSGRGMQDLYLFDLDTQSLRPVTADSGFRSTPS